MSDNDTNRTTEASIRKAGRNSDTDRESGLDSGARQRPDADEHGLSVFEIFVNSTAMGSEDIAEALRRGGLKDASFEVSER